MVVESELAVVFVCVGIESSVVLRRERVVGYVFFFFFLLTASKPSGCEGALYIEIVMGHGEAMLGLFLGRGACTSRLR